MGVDEVCGPSLSEKLPHWAAVVERMNQDRLEERRKAGLSGDPAVLGVPFGQERAEGVLPFPVRPDSVEAP